MVSWKELKARVKQDFRFSGQELQGILVGVLVSGFVFSFRHWGGEQFELVEGLKNLVLMIIAAGLSFFGHIAPQKIYALSAGYQMEFKSWWAGIVVMLVLAFISAGNLTLILAGGATTSFMVRQRLGKFRYGYSQEEQAIIGLWGVLGSLIMAALFRIFDYFIPGVLFFEQGMMISLILAICSLLPIPWLEGLNIFFGARGIYFVAIIVVLVTALLLLWGGGIGLLVGIIGGLLAGGIAILYGSEV